METANPAEHLLALSTVSYYRAPDSARIRPYTIPENFELVEVLTGGTVYFTNAENERIRYGKGAIFWHQSGEHTIFDTTPEAPYRCAVFRFEVGSRKRPVPRVGFWRQPGRLDEFCADVMELFSAGADRAWIGCYAYGMLLRQFCTAPEGARPGWPASLNRALAYLDARHEARADLNALVRISGAGQAQLFRLFRAYLGTTPGEYAHRRAMAHARLLLLSSPLPIKAIARECGFSGIEVFYRNFRRANGMPPGEFQRRHQAYSEWSTELEPGGGKAAAPPPGALCGRENAPDDKPMKKFWQDHDGGLCG